MEFYTKKYESLSISSLCLLGVVLSLGNTWPPQQQLLGNLGVILVFGILLLDIYKQGIKMPTLGILVGLFLLGFYLFSSIAYNKPSVDRNGVVCLNNTGWWMDYSKMCVVSFIAGVFCLAQIQRVALLFAFSGGAFLLPIAFTVYSIYLDGETKYGPIHNFLTGQIVNSCGVMSLVVFLPVFYAAGIFNKIIRPNQKHLIILLFIYSIASAIGYLYSSRSVFIIIYILVFLMSMFFYLQDRWRKISGLKIAYLVSALVLLVLILQKLERPVGLDVLKDVRFDAYFSFLQQLVSSPLTYAKVPLSFEQVASNHFHNFFADAHRLSGFWSFLSAVLLVGYIGIRVLQAAIKAPEGRMLLMVFIPVFLILNTTVVPEGEFQPILLILLLGGCAESILREKRIQRDKNAIYYFSHIASLFDRIFYKDFVLRFNNHSIGFHRNDYKIMDGQIAFVHLPKTGGSSLSLIFKKNINLQVINLEMHRPVSIKYPPRHFKYLTVMRNPIDRVWSYYQMTLRNSKNMKHAPYSHLVNNGLDFFLQHCWEVRNMACRYYSGRILYEPNAKILEIAWKNLLSFQFVLNFENLCNDASAMLIKLGLFNISIPKINSHEYNEITQDQRKLISKYNIYDIELYERWTNK